MTNSKKNKGKKSNKSSLNSLTRKNNGKQSQSSTITSNKKQFSSNQSQIQNKNTSNVSSLQDKFKKKLEGARFRVINEQLYTCTGNEAYDSFQQDKNLFKVYHEGFREQAAHWPQNPLDNIIAWIKSSHNQAVIADMGCGDARLASSLKNTTYSFDLVSVNDKVTACDMAHVPLPDAAVDIVVFCLSLMGTNIGDFLRESHRILKSTGILKIAEVRSRFEGEENGFKKFTSVLKQAGFDIRTKDSSNKMFFFVECVKTTRQPDIDPSYSLLPCIYKRR